MKQTNYKNSFNSLKGLFLTGLVLLSSSLLGQVYNVNFQPLDFRNGVLISGTGSTVNSAGSKILFSNVITINGDAIDCIVTNVNGTIVLDAALPSTYTSTSDRGRIDSMFIPQITTNNSYSSFRFEFMRNSSPVVLENVFLNIYDIDGDGGSNSPADKINIETDFTRYEVFASSTTFTNTRSTTDEDFLYRNSSNNPESVYTSNNGSGVVNDGHRVRVTFSTVSEILLKLGTNNKNTSTTNFFYLAFSRGTNATSTTVNNNSIQLDLNTITNGLNNLVTYNTCNSLVNLSSGNPNITATSTAITNLLFSYNSADITNDNSEFLVIDTSNIKLKPTRNNASGVVRVNSTSFNYNVTIDGTLGRNTITFTKTNMTLSEAEALLDAMQFKISNCSTPAGSRVFGINATLDLATDIQSPTVFFVANIPTALPVNVISFTGLSKTEGNQLNWTVAQEVDFSHYEVLRSTNGKEFTKIGEVYPENKSTDMKNYAFLDASVNADLSYYKLNLINEDGSSSYSNLVVINRNVVAPVITKLYPNPASTSLLVSLEGVDAELSTITIQDLSGKIVYSTETSDVATLLNINELNKGMYIVKVANQFGFVSVSRFTKN